MKTLSTNRLILRLPKKEDAPFFFTLLNSNGWLTHIGDRNVKAISDAERYIQTLLDGFERDNYGFYVVESMSQKSKVGMCGLIKRDIFDHLDLGFAVLPEYYRNGYTYEASLAILDYGFNTLNQKTILGITSLENFASQRLLKKLGMTEQGVKLFKGEKTLVYSLNKEQSL